MMAGGITIRCVVCSRQMERPKSNIDPVGTRTVLMTCARCTTKKATVYDMTFLDGAGNDLEAPAS